MLERAAWCERRERRERWSAVWAGVELRRRRRPPSLQRFLREVGISVAPEPQTAAQQLAVLKLFSSRMDGALKRAPKQSPSGP